jgi:hypothetical protein
MDSEVASKAPNPMETAPISKRSDRAAPRIPMPATRQFRDVPFARASNIVGPGVTVTAKHVTMYRQIVVSVIGVSLNA